MENLRSDVELLKISLKKKLDKFSIKIDFKTIDKRINKSKDIVEAFPEIFEFDYPSNKDFEEMQKILIELWSKYPRKELGGKSPEEASSIGQEERRVIQDIIKEVTRKLNPDDYDSVEDAQKAINKFKNKCLRTPQKKYGGKTPRRVILEERQRLGNPNKKVDIPFELKQFPDYDENKAEKIYFEGVNLFKQGAVYKAQKCFIEVVEMYPENYKAWGNLGNCFVCMGMKKEAIKCYKKALSIEPGYEFARKNWDNIKDMPEEELANRGMSLTKQGSQGFLNIRRWLSKIFRRD